MDSEPRQVSAYVCIIGNDGTGKSTTCSLITQKTNFQGVQRSMKQSNDEHIKKLVKQIKNIDKLTYSYAFQEDWYNFDITRSVNVNGVQIPVYWVLLTAPVEVLSKRINTRSDMTIYEHEKCIQYFNYVYEEMGYFYGMNLVKSDQSVEHVLSEIIQIVKNSKISLPIRNLTINCLNKHELEQKIGEKLGEAQILGIYDQKILIQMEKTKINQFYFPGLYDFGGLQVKRKLASKWIKNHAHRQFKDNKLHFKFSWGIQKQKQQILQIQLEQDYLFQNIVQGQSKILYKILTNNPTLNKNFHNKVIIVLKSTIYSHTNQRTSQISQLGKVRAKGSMVFLQMLKRNHIKHSYVCVNRDGIILSRFVQVNSLEIVFKKECLGTDKYSFFGIQGKKEICDVNNCYQGGIYVRFDWRNPNHIFTPNHNITLNEDPYYYLIQKIAGKQNFFTKFLTTDKCKPMGDKCITQDVIKNYTNTKLIKQKTIQAYCTFQYYAHEVGLEILDGCMMIDKDCEYIWSEINPDCLRVKSIKEREDYDKDIWRAGGSSSKDQILKKWTIFNEIFVQYFKNHRFMDSQVTQQLLCKQIYAKQLLTSPSLSLRPEYKHMYQALYRGNRPREFIGTLDIINGEPILVQSSQFKEKHSSANIEEALDYLSIVPQILLVDIDGASGKSANNQALITQIANNTNLNLFAVGGGIRSIQTANDYLTKFQHIVISSNLDIITQIPLQNRKKIIVQLSINQKNQILTHARTINTGTHIIKKMIELVQLGIQTISITFNNSEGKLQGVPRQQLRKLMYEIPGPIKKVIIAGGISNIDDMEFIWGFRKCVPQLGSAIWKRKVLIGEIYARMVRFDENLLVPAVIQDRFGKNLGLVYLNQQALVRSCEQRQLYRYSRQHKSLMKKGDQSGNTQHILSINIDCDNDSLLITVSTQHPIFCHKQTQSCFYQDINKSTKMTINQLQSHIAKTKNGGGSGYTHKIQNNPKLAIMKVMEEAEELSLAENRKRKVQECGDLMAHLIMFMNAEGIRLEEVETLLNQRSKIQKKPNHNKNMGEQQKIIRVGIAAGKHTKLIFQFLQKTLGVRILPHPQAKQRNYTIHYEITDEQKFTNSIKTPTKDHKVIFISMKPKDLSKLMYKNYIHYGINYSNVVENSCDRYHVIAETPVQGLRLALIKRKGQNIGVQGWSEKNKGLIISEYPLNLVQYFTNKNIPSNYYSLIKVSGHSEGFLSDKKFHYCDAIVFSGKTIQDNNLEIEAIIKSEIKVILFSLAE